MNVNQRGMHTKRTERLMMERNFSNLWKGFGIVDDSFTFHLKCVSGVKTAYCRIVKNGISGMPVRLWYATVVCWEDHNDGTVLMENPCGILKVERAYLVGWVSTAAGILTDRRKKWYSQSSFHNFEWISCTARQIQSRMWHFWKT